MGDSEKLACCLGCACCCVVVFVIAAMISFSTIEPLEWGLKYSSLSKTVTSDYGKKIITL